MSTNAHPTVPEFDYVKPDSLEDASAFLLKHTGDARPLAGGTDSFVRMRDGFWKEKYLVDIKKLPGMDQIIFDPRGGLTIGAAVTMNQLAAFEPAKKHYQALAQAANTVASYQLRNRATIVGNICNASPAGDSLGACLLYDGELNIFGPDDERKVVLSDFFTGPGKTTLKAGEIVTSIHFPPAPEGANGVYLKHGRNNASDLAIVGITVLAIPNAVNPSGYTFKLALASVAPVPLVVTEFTEYLADKELDADVFKEAGVVAMNACKPIDDVRSSAKYRSMMVRNLTTRALTMTWNLLVSK